MKTVERIFDGKVLAPSSIIENIEFNSDRPYTISVKCFKNIDTNQYILQGKQVFYIPPQYIHSVNVIKCKGVMYVLKISLNVLSGFIDIENILKHTGLSILSQPFVCNAFENMHKSIKELIINNQDIFLRLQGVLKVFKILSGYLDCQNEDEIKIIKASSKLKELIDWSINDFNRSIEQAAKKVNYSKYYFCKWFKKSTGITYHNYLKHLKIEFACKLLAENHTVSQVANLCGYENISYFIRLFSNAKHCTPKQFILNYINN